MTTPTANPQSHWADQLNAPGAVLAKFTAAWCGPCKAMEPILDRLEADPNTPPLVRVDVDEAPELAARYGVRAMPTLMLLQDGKAVRSVVGVQSHAQLVNFLTG